VSFDMDVLLTWRRAVEGMRHVDKDWSGKECPSGGVAVNSGPGGRSDSSVDHDMKLYAARSVTVVDL